MQIEKMSLGPVVTNCFIVADDTCGDCVIIDPACDAPEILGRISSRGWRLRAIWLTHAHFDHFGAVADIVKKHPGLPFGMHGLDFSLYQAGGGARAWGIPVDCSHAPTMWWEHNDSVQLGRLQFDVMFVPGHSPGHVAFFERESNSLFGGDVLFQQGIGRTDLPGGDHAELLNSIRTHFLPLPEDTIVYSGHGNDTTIGAEKRANPFLA